ncbi:helix-turn-helix transcriptional regulator [Entomobacter blattae]|uniref:Helix-turn-helix protein n=1 Tax=Entomobacter blattae TaxID=2762277 RepID=A0A7H1NS53_9PROT|nr:helix-turn-helix transcriptional regulator [Entomobacter blattae]QNT78613.1 helix-turn-helix protein [Entomobacter blattae]
MDIKDIIRTERMRLKLSQRDLAKAMKVSPAAVAHWELGTTRPTMDKMVDICTFFGITTDSLFNKDGPYQGQFVYESDELTLLTLWRSLSPEDKAFCLKLMRNSALSNRKQNPSTPD